MLIRDMPVMGGRPHKPASHQGPPFSSTPFRSGVTGDPGLPPIAKPPSLQPHKPSPRRDMFVRRIILVVVVFFTLIAVLDALAPHDYSKPAAIPGPGAVSGAVCPLTFSPVSATAVNSSGPYTILRVTCSDSAGHSMIVTVAR